MKVLLKLNQSTDESTRETTEKKNCILNLVMPFWFKKCAYLYFFLKKNSRAATVAPT